AEELAEAGSATFTVLDAPYLDQCFLFGDAARALEVDRADPLGRATAAFAWTLRQVGLRQSQGPAAPPAFVLRRGYGSARERGLVFLALLQQFGIHGCQVVVPDGGP